MDRFTKKTFSRNLKIVREMHGQTQREFAERINMTSATVSAWEKGSSFPSENALRKIIETYSVKKDILLNSGDYF